jgi:aminoglycoside phosphotransferase (APT) family kinase protein
MASSGPDGMSTDSRATEHSVPSRMHADELPIDEALVARLVASQFPQWRELAIERVPSAGTDNALFRLGPELVVRLPRMPGAGGGIDTECRWLPRLAPLLPLAIPEPVGKGRPSDDYPLPWSVCRWLDGEIAGSVREPIELATALAGFIRRLRAIPLPSEHARPQSYRGGPLAERDQDTRAAIAECGGLIDTELATEAWQAALRLPPYDGEPQWFHGDLKPDNLLVRQGELSAVLDWGCLAIGDPAVDQIIAWNFLTGEARQAFRSALAADDASWARGRGWALSIGLVALPYYRHTNPELAAVSAFQIRQVLADYLEHIDAPGRPATDRPAAG